MTRWKKMVLAAWLRRIIPFRQTKDSVKSQADYHPGKGHKIYRRYPFLVDVHIQSLRIIL